MIFFDNYILPEDPKLENYLIGTYLLRTPAKDVFKLTAAMASEQTIGTWTEVPGCPRRNRHYQG